MISSNGPPPYMMFGVNTSVPPPPIVNVSRRVSPPTLMENTNPDVRKFFILFYVSKKCT